MRSYDVMIRCGGDKFVCAMPNMNLTDARERISQIAAALAAGPDAVRSAPALPNTDSTRAQGKLIAR